MTGVQTCAFRSQRIVWERLINQRSNLAKSLKEQKERYEALHHELNPRTTQAESSHDPLYRDNVEDDGTPTITHSLIEHLQINELVNMSAPKLLSQYVESPGLKDSTMSTQVPPTKSVPSKWTDKDSNWASSMSW